MIENAIAEVGIDEEGRLWVRPSDGSFEAIYRAGREVRWDHERKRIFGPPPREWSYPRWFEQIVAAAAEEYGVSLKLNSETGWQNVPDDVKADIEALA